MQVYLDRVQAIIAVVGEEAYEEARREGYEEGYREGYEEGRKEALKVLRELEEMWKAGLSSAKLLEILHTSLI